MRLSGLALVHLRQRGNRLVFACSLAAALILLLGTAACSPASTKQGTSGGTSGTSGATSVAPSGGPSSEGPYPYAYPASGDIKAGTGTTISGTACTTSTPQFPGAYA